MVSKLLTGNAAAAWGARLAEVDYVPAFPITPQTEIIETLAEWFSTGRVEGQVRYHGQRAFDDHGGRRGRGDRRSDVHGDIEPGAGVRDGIALHRRRLARAVGAGQCLARSVGSDHAGARSQRCAWPRATRGSCRLHAETCQEVLDTVLMAFRIAEDERVSLARVW